ncbi:MAG TPA: TIGR04190 family B12-binding domain/radical SAM domain protein [Bacillota bacterium]|nr:TIGR04190 family B12-binding domain/radical SAM domain protein [Bacillota bacterium]
MLSAVFRTDLTLLHAPSVYDFRTETVLRGPVSDVVPSTDEFEMYPVGLTSIAAYLARNHYNVRIVNLAYRMLRDPDFNVPAAVRRMRSRVFGIDLHWLPHAHGALAIAEMIKRLHPESLVLLGGLSATYYHEELIRYPFVDFVLRGDSTEEPARQLLAALRTGGALAEVENLTWKRVDGAVAVNPLSFVPADLDYVDVPDYRYIMRSVFKYGNVANLIPYLEWLRYPTTLLLNARGCEMDCAVCGGSRTAYREVCNRRRPAFRSPERLVGDVRAIASFSRAPIFMVHDPRMGGHRRAERFFELVRRERVPNEFVFELFYPAGADFFAMIDASVPAWSLEITIESPDEELRMGNGKFPVPNAEVERTLAAALAAGCRKLDLFFMVGIPHQTYAMAMGTVEYCEKLAERFHGDHRLQFYISPLGPFLDPGCRAFEDPRLGYHSVFRSLEAHRQALLQPTWDRILSYETEAMTRADVVAASYDAAEGLNDLKLRHGLIDRGTHDTVASHLAIARGLLRDAADAQSLPPAERQAVYRRLREAVAAANKASIVGSDELKWGDGRHGLRVTATLLRALLGGLVDELGHAAHRLTGRYDTARCTVARRPAAPAPSPMAAAAPVD